MGYPADRSLRRDAVAFSIAAERGRGRNAPPLYVRLTAAELRTLRKARAHIVRAWASVCCVCHVRTRRRLKAGPALHGRTWSALEAHGLATWADTGPKLKAWPKGAAVALRLPMQTVRELAAGTDTFARVLAVMEADHPDETHVAATVRKRAGRAALAARGGAASKGRPKRGTIHKSRYPGMTNAEAAAALDLSLATFKRRLKVGTLPETVT